VTGIAAGGDGIARDADGRVVFVEGGIPGDRVLVEITQTKRDFARARVAEVLTPSPDRVEPPCPYVAAGCGGCQWQHIALDAQRRLKRDIVVDALRRLARVRNPPVADDVPGVADHGYRTTLRLAVTPAGRAAFHRRHSHDLIAVDACLISHPALADQLAGGRYSGRTVELRVGDQVEVAGRRWRVSPGSFFQSGPAAAQLLVEAVRAAAGPVGPGDLVVDAYAGVGLLGGALVDGTGARLMAIESHPGAARDAKANLRGLDARVLRMEVGEWKPPDDPVAVVVADPARTGLGKPGVAALAAADAAVLVLVSCDPASLARDTGLLVAAGYRLASVQVLDLFPHTVHVETVSRFERAPAR